MFLTDPSFQPFRRYERPPLSGVPGWFRRKFLHADLGSWLLRSGIDLQRQKEWASVYEGLSDAKFCSLQVDLEKVEGRERIGATMRAHL